MIPSAHFREQHSRARALTRRILQSIDRYRAPDDAFVVVLDIARLTGMLTIHFAQVDKSLVPRLCEGDVDDEKCRLARRFREEFGELSELVKIFNQRWSCSAAINGDLVAFRVDVQQLIHAIEERFAQEESDLFKANDFRYGANEVEMTSAPVRPPLTTPRMLGA